MFKIDSNQVIKMSKGDNIKFPLFLNKHVIYLYVNLVKE